MISSNFKSIFKFEFIENIRNKWIFINFIITFLFSSFLLSYSSSNPSAALTGLINLNLLMIPLFSLLFGSISFFNSFPFFEFILSKSVSRKEIYLGKYIGLGLGLCFSNLLAYLFSMIFFININETGFFFILFLFLSNIALNFLFLSISFLISSMNSRIEIIIGIILSIWFYFYLLHDLIIIFFSIQMKDYPLEVPVFILTILNPLDMVRIIFLLHLDLATLMSFGTAIFQKFLGNTGGVFVGIFILLFWNFLFLYAGLKKFRKKVF